MRMIDLIEPRLHDKFIATVEGDRRLLRIYAPTSPRSRPAS